MNYAQRIARDAGGIARICGTRVALKWLAMIGLHNKTIRAQRHLQAADRAMGNGPFFVRSRSATAQLSGVQVFSGLREIWVRDVYLRNGLLSIPINGLVVDLGANLGVFSMLALGSGQNVRCIAVEPGSGLLSSLQATARLNKVEDRLTAVRGFVGDFTDVQSRDIRENSDYADAPVIFEQQLIDLCDGQRISFLKCDIEGSEFGLLHKNSRLLARTDRLAIELHAWGGDIRAYMNDLTSLGFTNLHTEWAGESCIALFARAQ